MSDRKELVLQALEIMSHNKPEWVKASDLRYEVRHLMSYLLEEMGDAQWVGHILNRLQLINSNRKKAYSGEQMYVVARGDVLDMMRRYEDCSNPCEGIKTFIPYMPFLSQY